MSDNEDEPFLDVIVQDNTKLSQWAIEDMGPLSR